MFDEKTQRKAFWSRVFELAKENRNIVVVSADQNAPVLDHNFIPWFPDRFVNVGIAEQAAVLVASGLALEGKIVFTHAITPFITLRVLEQVKMQMGVMKIPITLVGVGAGLSYLDSGPTHHALDDISAMRAIPNVQIHNISDDVMAGAFADIACQMSAPRYVRLDRRGFPDIHEPEEDFLIGVSVVRDGNDLSIIGTGNMVHRAIDIANALAEQSISVRVIDLYTFPVNAKALIAAIAGAKMVATIEEHYLSGGMGSAVLEVFADCGINVPVTRIGADPALGYTYQYGGREKLQEIFGLDKENATKVIMNAWSP